MPDAAAMPDPIGALPPRQLRIFDAAVRTGAAGAAARALGLSQPAVTHALHRLETRLGRRLLERGPGGTHPTEAGRILHRRAVRLAAQLAAALAATRGDARAGQRAAEALTAPQLRCHLAIAAQGGFAAAARALGLSLPAVQRAARGLEQLAGVALYRRQLREIGVTPAGAELARRLRVALTELDQARAELAVAEGQGGGRVTAGCLPLMPKPLLARACGAALRLHPGLRIALIEDAYDPLLRALRGGEIDVLIGALRPDGPADIAEVPLFDDPYVVVARARHPLTGSARLGLDALAPFGWVAAPSGTPRRAALERLFAGRDPARVVLETNSTTTMLAMLQESDALSVTARSLAAAAPLAVLPLPVPADGRRVGQITRADWLPTAEQAGFVACLRSAVGAVPEPPVMAAP